MKLFINKFLVEIQIKFLDAPTKKTSRNTSIFSKTEKEGPAPQVYYRPGDASPMDIKPIHSDH